MYEEEQKKLRRSGRYPHFLNPCPWIINQSHRFIQWCSHGLQRGCPFEKFAPGSRHSDDYAPFLNRTSGPATIHLESSQGGSKASKGGNHGPIHFCQLRSIASGTDTDLKSRLSGQIRTPEGGILRPIRLRLPPFYHCQTLSLSYLSSTEPRYQQGPFGI